MRSRLKLRSYHLRRQKVAHFLHIGKTAGTAVSTALNSASSHGRYHVMMWPHGVTLVDVPAGDDFLFCVRDPLTRYVSGFLSRQRQGRPAHNSPWRPEEERAFGRFDTPDALGVALLAGGTEQHAAEDAMRSIAHVNRSYWYWFRDEAHLRRRKERILWIGRQEELDLASLASALDVAALELPSDGERAHRAPAGSAQVLSPEAAANLRQWYSRDYEFLQLCDELDPSGGDVLH